MFCTILRMMIFLLGYLWFAILTLWQTKSTRVRFRAQSIATNDVTNDAPTKTYVRFQPKPPWVRRELFKLMAYHPELGCRKIADIFNRMFHEQESVSKSTVARLKRNNAYHILQLRRTLKHHVPRHRPTNLGWGIDLTQVKDHTHQAQTLLGVVDHGSRANLALLSIPDKASLTLLKVLIQVIEKYGKPKSIRTDNESVFTSRIFRWGLKILNIKHQLSAKHCPWQNGRIERFFGTFKQIAKKRLVFDVGQLQQNLDDFRCWYNHCRPHQHLQGRTPAEVWDGHKAPINRPDPVRIRFWNGALNGYYFGPQ